jgi:hypothetical protein
MGTVICRDDRLIATLNDFRKLSTVFNAMMNEILDKGDLTIHLQNGDSCYENRNIVLATDKLVLLYDLLSTCIMEICNAWVDTRQRFPLPQSFNTATEYAKALEKEEWHAVKKHIKIHKQLLTTPWGVLGPSRFAASFTAPQESWDNFENYLAHQRKTGHTAKIEKNWTAPK